MINHSCRPNANHAWNEATEVEEVRATTNIEPGREICICYLNNSAFHVKTGAERREEIKEQFGFECRLVTTEKFMK
jgi:hypothetical protein